MSEPLHVYDWLDPPAADEHEARAKEWLNNFAREDREFEPATLAWLKARSLTCEWQGRRWWCRGCSSMGDVWITRDPTRRIFYDHRVDVRELSQWRTFVGRGNLQPVESELAPEAPAA
jgi:hypothetical protein